MNTSWRHWYQLSEHCRFWPVWPDWDICKGLCDKFSYKSKKVLTFGAILEKLGPLFIPVSGHTAFGDVKSMLKNVTSTVWRHIDDATTSHDVTDGVDQKSKILAFLFVPTKSCRRFKATLLTTCFGGVESSRIVASLETSLIDVTSQTTIFPLESLKLNKFIFKSNHHLSYI